MGINVSQFGSEDHWSSSKAPLQIHHRSRILKKLSYEALWESFLNGTNNTFAITLSELQLLCESSLKPDFMLNDDIKGEIKDYLDFLVDLTKGQQAVDQKGNKEAGKSPILVDFLAICSSILFVSDINLDDKIDILYKWIDITMNDAVSFEEMYLAVTTFEKGIAFALGKQPADERYLKYVSTQWCTSCGFLKESESTESPEDENFDKNKFFEFCTNRQQYIRKMIDTLATAPIQLDKSNQLQELRVDCIKEPLGGDEWMSNPAWKKTAELMTPKTQTFPSGKPDINLKLEWVYGYRGFDCRNNVRYGNADASQVIYNAAALGVILNDGHQQSYFGEHTDDVVCVAVTDPTLSPKTLVATGEMGKNPAIHVWAPDNHESLLCLKGYHTKAIAQMTFSHDSKFLFSIGIEYTVGLYSVDQGNKQFGKLVASSQGPKGKVYHVCQLGDDYLSCGEKHIVFWKIKSNSLTLTNVQLGELKNKIFLSVASIQGGAAVGTSDGDIIIFNGQKIQSQHMRLECKSVNSLWSPSNGNYLLVGGNNGLVLKFSVDDLKSNSGKGSYQKLCFSKYSVEDCAIRSVCMSSDDSRILIGTNCCEILEVYVNFDRKEMTSAKVLVSGHFKNELWGLAVCPIPGSNEFATVGDDSYLRVFDAAKRCMISYLNLGCMARCCEYSHDGSLLAIGFGGRVGKGKQKNDGMFRVYRVNRDTKEFMLAHEGRDAKQWISDIKFSSDGRLLAVGAHDNCIYVYSVTQQFKLKFKFTKHNSYITHFDFSSDDKYIQSNCGAYELLFCEVGTGKQVLKSSALADVPWDTWTCPLGWPVQGIWPACADGTDINAVDRSPSQRLIASADDFGKVKIFNFPCVNLKSSFECYSGHSSHVTNVRWSCFNGGNDDLLFSTGGNDKCIFQWRNVLSSHQGGILRKSGNVGRIVEDSEDEEDSNEDMDGPLGGDEFMAIKPWKGAIVAPSAAANPDPTRASQFKAALGELSAYNNSIHERRGDVDYDVIQSCAEGVLDRLYDSGFVDNSTPNTDEFEISWVHGYRGFDTRNNLRYVSKSSDNLQQSRNIVYFTAKLGVCMNLAESDLKQQYFKGHTDDIISMATHSLSNGDFVIATGQLGKGNTYIWEASTSKLISTLLTNQKSVCMLEFSTDGKYLISVAEDNTVAISDWAHQRVIANVKGEPAPTYHIATSDDMKSLAFTCGDKYMRIWSLDGRNFNSVKVPVSKGGKIQKFLSVVLFNGSWIVGCADGSLYLIDKQAKLSGVKTHPGTQTSKDSKTKVENSVTALFSTSSELVSGTKFGNICVWNAALEVVSSLVISKEIVRHITAITKQVQSISLIGDGAGDQFLLVGTRGCDILEFRKDRTGEFKLHGDNPKMNGHYNDELWGLATHPHAPRYCTVGDDKTLRLWSIHPNRMIECKQLDIMARTCAYDPTGSLIAVGFGGSVGRGKQKLDGLLRIYDEKTLSMLCEATVSKQWISDIKFSPDGNTLAIGSHDRVIYLYSIVTAKGQQGKPTISLKAGPKFCKHNSYITHFDFSSDGRFLQSNCGAYELLFSEISSGKQLTQASELKDVRWSTWTCTLGWPVQGIWPSGADGTDINAVSRSHSGHLVATSDDFGKVNVFRYPCTKEGTGSLKLLGHSSHVMNVRWSVGDECLISCGGNDKSIFVWKHIMTNVDAVNLSAELSKRSLDMNNELADESTEETEDEPSGGDEFMAVKPWKGAIRAPPNPPAVNPAAPSSSLALKWVHGYTSGSAGACNSRISNNLFFNSRNEVIYPAAALGVILSANSDDPRKSTQVYFQRHDDDILCLNVSQDRRFVATGQTASKTSRGKGSICVWDAVDCRLLCEVKECHQRGVISLAFSPDSTKLVSIGLDNSFEHIVWGDKGGNWSNPIKIASNKSDQKVHLYSKWIAEGIKTDCQFVSGGATSIHFWAIEGSSLTSKESKLGKFKQQPLLCAANLDFKKEAHRIVAGTSGGDLYVFDGRECVHSVEKAHGGAILCLTEGTSNSFLISGGMDKCIKIWNSSLTNISIFQLDQNPLISPVNASVGSIDFRIDSDGNIVVLAGTYGGEILEIIAGQSERTSKSTNTRARTDGGSSNLDLASAGLSVLMHSHYSGELWGLAPHPEMADIYATAGDDGTVRIWSISKKQMLSCVNTQRPARSICWNHQGDILAVGFFESTKGGGVKAKSGGSKKKSTAATAAAATANSPSACFLYSVNSTSFKMERLGECCPSTAWISDIKFSPSDSILAIGSHDKSLYFYNLPTEGNAAGDAWGKGIKQRFKPFNKHSSAITHFDFSVDEKYWQSNCQAYELLFGNLETGNQETSATKLAIYNGDNADNESIRWASLTCTLGWPVQGIWEAGQDGSDINAVDRSPDNSLLATADDFGLVKLFRYPCISENAKFNKYSGHSSHVTCVRWTSEDNLLSVGGNDKCVFVWELHK